MLAAAQRSDSAGFREMTQALAANSTAGQEMRAQAIATVNQQEQQATQQTQQQQPDQQQQDNPGPRLSR